MTRQNGTDSTSLSPITPGLRLLWGIFAAWLAVVLLIAGRAEAAAPPAGTVVAVQAYAEYLPPNAVQMMRSYSNEVRFIIQAVESLTLTGNSRVRVQPGTHVTLPYLLTNTGNVASSYTLAPVNGGPGCAADDFDLSALSLVEDRNNNGVADPGEPVLSGPYPLAYGRSASLLLSGDVPANLSTGVACLSLTATTQLQNVSATANTQLVLGSGAAVSVGKIATYSSPLVPGASAITYTLRAQNIGTQPATQASTDGGATPTTILVNGAAKSMFLLRDPIAADSRYVFGSLQSTAAGAIKLFRLPGDAPFSYRTAEDASAIEVAVGFQNPITLVPGGSIEMRFQTQLLASAGSGNSTVTINQGYANFNDGGADASAVSNPVVLPLMRESIGIALAAGNPVPQFDANGIFDGTAIVRLTTRVRNYGTAPAFDLQVVLPLQGAAPLLGTYTPALVPGAGQYTLIGKPVMRSGVGVALNAGYTGAGPNDRLLGPGVSLAPGTEFVVEWDVRINFSGITAPLGIQARAEAARQPGSAVVMTDNSVNGLNPDPSGLGRPQDYASITPISIPPSLRIIKTATPPVRLPSGEWELTYTLTAINESAVAAAHLRFADNLQCTIGQASGVTGWKLVAPPTVKSGNLTINPNYTGAAPCNGPRDSATGLPLSDSVFLTDGSTALAPGATAQVTFKIRVSISTPYSLLTNTAWAASFSAAPVGTVNTANSTSVVSLLVDPQGIIYDSVTRAPLGGATVTLRRESCSIGALSPVTPAEIFPQPGITYSFDTANRSVSMTTAADGEYQFFFMDPPVNTLCDYSISVTPPAGYMPQSATILPQPGVFTSCGNVVPLHTAPQAGDPTDYYRTIRVGELNPGPPPSLCEVTHNHIPLDPVGKRNALLLEKISSKKAVEFGDFVDYQLKIINRSGEELPAVSFTDTLPPGFAYVPGSTRINGERAADPAGGIGPRLVFNVAMPLADRASLSVGYRVRVGVGARTEGDATNRATAASGTLVSNEATATVRVTGGPFADDAYAFGKVHLDCNANGEQDAGDLGIPGVRLLLETGASVITDSEGRWSLYGLRPLTHAIKVDRSTLPKGAVLAPWDNRNAGDDDSRFLDLKKGEFGKANFPVISCDDAVKQQVDSRREAYANRPDAELEAAVSTRLAVTPAPVLVFGDRPLLNANSSGEALAIGETQSLANETSGALIELPGNLTSSVAIGAGSSPLAPVAAAPSLPEAKAPSAPRAGGADLLGPLAAPGVIDLEKLVAEMDAAPDFIDFKDGDRVASNVLNVRVKGPLGTSLRLLVNGQVIGDKRVGKKVSLESKALAAWEYIGMELKAGENVLTLIVLDGAGVQRGERSVRITAPDMLSVLTFEMPETPRADPLKPVTVTVRLSDRQGLPITARTQVTLESDRGRWLPEDLNRSENGTQVFIEGGRAEFQLQPPAEPGPARLRASANLLVEETVIHFLPEMRELTGIGILEGVLDFSRRGKLALGQAAAGSAFEQELRSHDRQDGDTRSSARAAFYFKGTIKGEYLLTTAYDSDKQQRDRLFRDIKPDEYYPVYGDGSVRGFDAQSSENLYVRIDKNRSYLLYGDFTTASSEEVRQLSQINRTLTGLKHKYETENVRVTSFASRDTTRQRVEELRAGGVSFYFLAGLGDIVAGTEKVELITRSRSQPQLILATRALARNVDYTFEPLTRRLLLVDPVSSLDPDFNPRSIRVTYEVDSGGAEFTIAGVDAQIKVNDSLQVGVVLGRDENPENQRELRAATALARLGEHTVLAAEAVETDSDLKGQGHAGRIELRHDSGRFTAQIQLQRTDVEFDNPSATGSPGRTEHTARAEYAVSDDLKLRSEANYSKDAEVNGTAGGERINVSASVQKKITPNLVVETGVRHGNTSGSTAGGFDYGQQTLANGSLRAGNGNQISVDGESVTTANARITLRPEQMPRLEVYGEGEQAIDDRDARMVAVGGHYAITDSTRVYVRHEVIDGINSDATLDAGDSRSSTLVGLESAYMEGGRVYNEARFNGYGGQNASGVRNSFNLNEHWTLNGSFERTNNFGGGDGAQSLAAAFGAQYIDGPWRGNGAIELRRQEEKHSGLLSLGIAYKMDRDWTALARSITTLDDGDTAGRHLISRQQIGLAWRPASSDVYNGLARYEYRYETLDPGTDLSGFQLFNTSGAVLPGDYTTHIVTAVGNANPRRGLVYTGRYAAKVNEVSDGANARYWAQLVQGRFTYDINADWDIGAQAGVLHGKGGALEKTAGLEVGYQAMPNIWLSAGYNFIGLDEPDLTGGDYTSEGLFVRVRIKFDEKTLGLGSAK